jgi:predicted nuclease of predicted toxin-antitoxin system
MTIKYLLDENMSSVYREQLLRYQPELTVLMVGTPNTPTRGTKDPDILHWCEQNNFILVTKNRSSMPVHLVEHLAQGYHVPGIFVLRRQAEIGQVIEDLILIAATAEENEYQDQITYIPLM